MNELKRFQKAQPPGLGWTDVRPSQPGNYFFKETGPWVTAFVRVRQGNWRAFENPDWLYTNNSSIPVKDLTGFWFGPIPELTKPAESSSDSTGVDAR